MNDEIFGVHPTIYNVPSALPRAFGLWSSPTHSFHFFAPPHSCLGGLGPTGAGSGLGIVRQVHQPARPRVRPVRSHHGLGTLPSASGLRANVTIPDSPTHALHSMVFSSMIRAVTRISSRRATPKLPPWRYARAAHFFFFLLLLLLLLLRSDRQ